MVHLGVILSALLLFMRPHFAQSDWSKHSPAAWEIATLGATRNSKISEPIAARASAIISTCIYDAWSAYDDRAIGTQLSSALRRPANERTPPNRARVASYAAYRALSDALPADTESVLTPLMRRLNYDPADNSTDIETPTGIGNVACAAVLEFRRHDKSNQVAELAQGAYSDWSHYSPVNPVATVPPRFPFVKPLNPNHWQPLTYIDSAGNLVLQMGAAWSSSNTRSCPRPLLRLDSLLTREFACHRSRPLSLR